MTNTSNNSIISFPVDRIVRLATPQDIGRTALQHKKQYIDAIIHDELIGLIKRLSMRGIDPSDDVFHKNLALTIECMRSTLYRNYGLDHPLHDSMDELISTLDEWAGAE